MIVLKNLYNTLAEKKIVILGFAFKADTNDTRESAAITICKDLIDEGAELIIHDPKVCPEQIERDLQINQTTKKNKKNEFLPKQNSGKWTFSKNLNIFDNAHAVIVLTEWDDYKNIEWDLIAKNMIKPSWIFDSRSILLSFDFVSSIFISYKTEFVSIVFKLFSFIFAGKFADASVIISFWATSIADEIPTIE